MQKLLTWLEKYNISTHTLAVIALALTAAYEGYAPFHALVRGWYETLPTPVQVLIGTGGFLYALYKTGALKGSSPVANGAVPQQKSIPIAGKISVLVMAGALAALMLPTQVTAQAGIAPGFGTTADAAHYQGNWYIGTTETESLDVKDFASASTSGYVNSLYLGGYEKIFSPTAGFNTYGGYFEIVPTATLAALISSTNIPADSFRLYFDGQAGETTLNAGGMYLTGGGTMGVDYAVTSSGSVVWNTVEVGWQNPGIWSVTSGLQVFLAQGTSGTVQSAKRAKLRRLAHALGQR